MDTETYECSVQFYHYEGLNFVYSAGLTFLLSSSWHRLNLIWSRVSLSLTPPLPALTTREQKRAFVKSYLRFLPPHFPQLTDNISPLQLSSSTALPFWTDTSLREGLKKLHGREWDAAEWPERCPQQWPPPGQVGDRRGTAAPRGTGDALPAPLPRGGSDTEGSRRLLLFLHLFRCLSPPPAPCF